MSEFSAAAELSISVPDRELSKARSKVESAIGPVPVRIEADGGVGGAPTGPGGRSVGGRDGTKELRDQTELLEAGQQQDYTRNVYLKEILEALSNDGPAGGGDNDGGGGNLLRLGGLGGLGLLGGLGGITLGSSLINFLKNFKFKPPSIPNVKVPKPNWVPPRLPKPDWVPLPVKQPDPLPIEDIPPLPIEDPAPFPVAAPDYIPVDAPSAIPVFFPWMNPTGDMGPAGDPSPAPAPGPRGYGSVTRDRPSPLGDPDEVPAEDPTPAPEIPLNREPYTPEAPLPAPGGVPYGEGLPGTPGATGPNADPDDFPVPSPEEIIGGVMAGGAAAGLKWGTGSGSGTPGGSVGLPISLAPTFAGASKRGPLSDILPGGNETVQRNRGQREMAFQQAENKAREAGGGSVARVEVNNSVEINDNRDLDRKLDRVKKETKREIERSFSGRRIR